MSNVISFCDYRQKKIEEGMDRLRKMSDEELLNLVEFLTHTNTVLDNYEMGDFTFTLEIDDNKDPS